MPLLISAAANVEQVVGLAEAVSRLDSLAIIVIIAFALWKGWLITPRELKRVEEDAETWKVLALESLATAERAAPPSDRDAR